MNKLALLAVLVLSLALTGSVLAQDKFKVDGVHSFVVFKIQHLGVSNAWGRFDDPAGTIVWDDADPSKSKLDVMIQANKIDTGNKKRDDHLRSADFFNVRQFPTITFKSTSIRKSSDNQYEVSGDLTLHGVTRPITVTLTKVGQADTRMGHRAGFETSFAIKRSEFGMSFMLDGLGDEVQIMVNLEAIKS